MKPRDVARLGVGAAGLVAVLNASPVGAASPADAAPPARVHAVKAGDTLRASAAIPEGNPRRDALPQPAPRPAALRPPAYIALAVPDTDELATAFAWPVEGPVTSSFGRRRSSWHRGIDIKAESGTPVHAAAAGVVVMSGVGPRYGRVIKVEHDGGFVTVYAHNDRNLVEAGERVDAGQMIATVGRTGRATTSHLHFEIRHQGRNYNPLYLLPLPPRIAGAEETDDNPLDD